MTRDEILTHIHNHPKMHHLLASIYEHEDYTWAKESGLNASACLYIDNSEHEGDLVVTSGAGDRSPDSDFLTSHNKYYHPNELTPEKIDQIIAEDHFRTLLLCNSHLVMTDSLRTLRILVI